MNTMPRELGPPMNDEGHRRVGEGGEWEKGVIF